MGYLPHIGKQIKCIFMQMYCVPKWKCVEGDMSAICIVAFHIRRGVDGGDGGMEIGIERSRSQADNMFTSWLGPDFIDWVNNGSMCLQIIFNILIPRCFCFLLGRGYMYFGYIYRNFTGLATYNCYCTFDYKWPSDSLPHDTLLAPQNWAELLHNLIMVERFRPRAMDQVTPPAICLPPGIVLPHLFYHLTT